jgi:ribosomal protein S18 acetylase RimI-like enzyme
MYNKWAHLDRLAVIEVQQGRGFGAAQLQYLLGVMQSMSANSVNLSTQEDNLRSHRLYRSFGFQQSTEKMGFYGLDL